MGYNLSKQSSFLGLTFSIKFSGLNISHQTHMRQKGLVYFLNIILLPEKTDSITVGVLPSGIGFGRVWSNLVI